MWSNRERAVQEAVSVRVLHVIQILILVGFAAVFNSCSHTGPIQEMNLEKIEISGSSGSYTVTPDTLGIDKRTKVQICNGSDARATVLFLDDDTKKPGPFTEPKFLLEFTRVRNVIRLEQGRSECTVLKTRNSGEFTYIVLMESGGTVELAQAGGGSVTATKRPKIIVK